MGTSSLTPEELKTVTNSDTPCLILTASGTVETDEEATIYIIAIGECCADRWATTALGRRKKANIFNQQRNHI